ncbi:MAG TPA: DUF6569 family protein [Aeromicrobium sp.]|nr:DUF6569 family protein [Aeromicrobium sp.]
MGKCRRLRQHQWRRLADVGTGGRQQLIEADVEQLVADVTPLDGQRGVVVAAGGRLSVDLFDKASTLNGYWDALVAGYAMDAIGGESAEATVDDATAFLHRVLRAEATPAEAAGEGTELHVDSDGIAGCALRWNDAVVHLAAFEVAP